MTANESYRVLCRELEKISESPSFEAFELLAGCAGLSRTQVLTGSSESVSYTHLDVYKRQ